MVQSAAMKQGRSANRKHTYFLALYIVPNQSFSFIQHRQPCCVIIRIFLAMTASCVRQLICRAHDRISEKVNLKVCCFESSKQKKPKMSSNDLNNSTPKLPQEVSKPREMIRGETSCYNILDRNRIINSLEQFVELLTQCISSKKKVQITSC